MRASVLTAFNTNVLLVMTYIATGTLTQAYIAMGQADVVTGALTFTYIPVGHFHKPTMHRGLAQTMLSFLLLKT